MKRDDGRRREMKRDDGRGRVVSDEDVRGNEIGRYVERCLVME